MRGAYHEGPLTNIRDEFYHGACHFFATALYSVLGPHDCAIYSLEARKTDGSVEFIHAIVDYLPHRLQSSANALPHQLAINEEADEGGSTYDISSTDGRAWECANYAFVADPYDNECPIVQNHRWPADLVQWVKEDEQEIERTIADYKNGIAPEKETQYWMAIEGCLQEALTQTLGATQRVVFGIS